MSSLPQGHQGSVDAVIGRTTTNASDTERDAVPQVKRAADDEIEFISSNPVKRARNAGPPMLPQQRPPLSPPASVTKPSAADFPNLSVHPMSERRQAEQAERCRSAIAVAIPPPYPFLDTGPDNRAATSLPAMETFSFPRSFPSPRLLQSAPVSEAISPRQLSKANASSLLGTDAVRPSTGFPSSAPGPDPSPSRGSVPMEVSGINTTATIPTSTPMPMANGAMEFVNVNMPLFSGPMAGMSSQGHIPFAMYSTGNLMALPQALPHGFTHRSSGQVGQQSDVISLAASERLEACKLRTGSSPGFGRIPAPHLHPPAQYFRAQTPAPSKVPEAPMLSAQCSSAAPGAFAKPPCPDCIRARQEAARKHGPMQWGLEMPFGHGHRPNSQPPSTPVSQQAFRSAQPSEISQMGSLPLSSHGRTTLSHPLAPASPSGQSREATPSPQQSAVQQEQQRRQAQNLLVDVAETALESFPVALVAARHGVAPQKVTETLEAVVQLPLLRCASDKRRAGKLGVERMREFREARKAWLSAGEGSAAGGEKAARQEDKTVATCPSAYELLQFIAPLEMPRGVWW